MIRRMTYKQIGAVSPFDETAPFIYLIQSDFVHGSLQTETQELLQVLQGDPVEAALAKSLGDHHGDGVVFDLLVVQSVLVDLLQGVRDGQVETEACEDLRQIAAGVVLREPHLVGGPGFHHHAGGNAGAVGDVVGAELLQAVAHGVAEVQELAHAGVPLVGFHDGLLDGDAALDDVLIILSLDMVDETLLHDHGALHRLRHTVQDLLLRQGVEGLVVADHHGRLPEGPRQVLSVVQIHRGLASHRGVHGGKESGGDLNVFDPPEIGGCGESGKVAHHAAPQGHDQVASGKALFGEGFQDIRIGWQVLGMFPFREDDLGGLKPVVPQGLQNSLQIQMIYIAVCHNTGPAGLDTFTNEFSRIPDDTLPYQDIIRPGRRHRESIHKFPFFILLFITSIWYNT